MSCDVFKETLKVLVLDVQYSVYVAECNAITHIHWSDFGNA